MNTCPKCGGVLWRHRVLAPSKCGQLPAGWRFRCRECGHGVSVRGGVVIKPTIGRPRLPDWRIDGLSEASGGLSAGQSGPGVSELSAALSGAVGGDLRRDGSSQGQGKISRGNEG
jgi:hypothetical protein